MPCLPDSLQQMKYINEVMPPDEYRLFSNKGYFTIHQADEFWAGSFTDQMIEQFLMRILKTSGGMTHGHGITDSTLAKWVHALPRCVPVCDALERLCSVRTATSEQHEDLCSSTKAKCNRDHGVFQKWLKIHQPFTGYQPDHFVSCYCGCSRCLSQL